MEFHLTLRDLIQLLLLAAGTGGIVQQLRQININAREAKAATSREVDGLREEVRCLREDIGRNASRTDINEGRLSGIETLLTLIRTRRENREERKP